MILRQQSQLKTLDVRVERGAECGLDHFIVKAKLFENYKKNVSHIMRDKDETENGEKALKVPKYNLEGLKEESIVFLYKLRLAEKIKSKKAGTVDERYTWLKDNLHQSAKEALGGKNANIIQINNHTGGLTQ
jgi:hypothetical protein